MLPSWYLDKPPIHPVYEIYLEGFRNLGSTRNFEHGQIPWDKIIKYGHHICLDDDIIDTFVAVIQAMDIGYLGWLAKEARCNQARMKNH